MIENAVGGSDYDAILGNDAKNKLYGMGGGDSLYGYGDDDILDGGAGGDYMVGMQGNDSYYVDSADDLVDERWGGSDGQDTVYASIPYYKLGDGVEGLVFQAAAGHWTGDGNDARNTIIATNMFAQPGRPSFALQFTLNGYGGNDLLTGSTATDIFTGGDGDDEMDGGGELWFPGLVGGYAPDQYAFADGWDHDSIANFRPGFDILDMRGVTGLTQFSQLKLKLVEEGTLITIGDDTANSITLIDIRPEQLTAASFQFQPIVGTDGADQLFGDASANVIQGLAGNDYILGGGGADVLLGGAGSDMLSYNDLVSQVDGGDDFDYLLADQSTAATGIHFTVLGTNIEYINAHTGDDVVDARGLSYGITFNGFSGADTFFGSEHWDVFLGQEGVDAFIFSGMSTDYTFTQYGGDGHSWLVTNKATGLWDTVYHVENLQFTDKVLDTGLFDRTINGGGADDVLTGFAGADTIRGHGGNDKLYGEGGNDRIEGGGRSELFGGDGDDTLVGGDTIDWMYGGTGNDTLIGAGGQTIMFGDDGDDALTGSLTSHNSMYGGLGNDSYTGGDLTDWISDTEGGNETVHGGGGYDVIVDYHGVNSLHGDDGDDWIISASNEGSLLDGGAGNDTLSAYFGGNTLLGGAGDDVLENTEGGALASIFTGGTGADTFIYRPAHSVDGNVVVTDFTDGVDHIGVRSPFSYEHFAITDTEAGAVISYYETSPMLLAGISASQITQEDFVMV